jgi:prolyl-tRNA editing enzyme YbaK/EbsC (Cys-tRNA(Pro) deacylase)
VLVVASGSNRVSVQKLQSLAGGPVRRADADLVKTATGFSIGGVPPVGLATDLRVLVDEDLLQYAEVWAAAGMPNAVFPIDPEQLVRITNGEVVDIRED